MGEPKADDLPDQSIHAEHGTADQDQNTDDDQNTEKTDHLEQPNENSNTSQNDQLQNNGTSPENDSTGNTSPENDSTGNGQACPEAHDLLDESDDDAELGESNDRSEEPRLCHEGCNYSGMKANSKIVKCRLCMVVHHIDCVGIEQKNLKKVGFWSCPSCRKMSQKIKNLQMSVKSLFCLVEQLTASIGPIFQQKQETLESVLLSKALTNKTKECEKLMEQNLRLQQQLAKKKKPDLDESIEIGNSTDTDSESEDGEDFQGHLLIGDSLIRNVEPITDNITIACRKGAKIHDLTKKLKKDKRKYSQITIVCGTNDIATKANVEKIGSKFNDLLQIARKRCKSITVSSIPPRLDDRVTEQKLKDVNRCLETKTKQVNANFVDNDLNFRFMSDIPDTSLLQMDGLHLSLTGVNRLLHNLALEGGAKCNLHLKTETGGLKPEESSVKRKVHTRSHNGVTVFLGKESIFSNLHMDTPIYIDGRTYTCNEQFYTHSMAMFFDDIDAAERSLSIKDPYQLINLQKEIANVDRYMWEPEAKRVLHLANMAKYTQNLRAREALLNTADDIIGEASFSKTWGVGLSIKDARSVHTKDWIGRNVMGRILMDIRDTLSSKPNDQSHSPRGKPYMTWTKSCWFCGEENHISKNCRHGQKIQCNSCKNYGHKSKFCKQY